MLLVTLSNNPAGGGRKCMKANQMSKEWAVGALYVVGTIVWLIWHFVSNLPTDNCRILQSPACSCWFWSMTDPDGTWLVLLLLVFTRRTVSSCRAISEVSGAAGAGTFLEWPKKSENHCWRLPAFRSKRGGGPGDFVHLLPLRIAPKPNAEH